MHKVKVVIYTEHLGRVGVDASSAELFELVQSVEEAVEQVMPHAQHDVQVIRKVSGAGGGVFYSVDGCDMSGTKEHSALERASNKAVEKWMRSF